MFVIVEESHIVLREKGVYRQGKVYLRNNGLYAGWGTGFIRLLKHDNGTSKPNVTYDELVLPFTPSADQIGRLLGPQQP